MAIDDFLHMRPGERTEADCLELFELLRRALSLSVGTEVQLGCYWIDDVVGDGCCGATARVRGRAPIEGIDSDSWEGLLGWSGNREGRGRACASIFPFRSGSVVQQKGRLADCKPGTETDHFVDYRLENGRFNRRGWIYGDGPGEWAAVVGPGSVYWQDLAMVDGPKTFHHGESIVVRLQSRRRVPINREAARVSLIHVNRDREHTNLVPWTAQPPKANSQHVQSISYVDMPTPDVVDIHLDRFSIRGGWISGRYYLAVRIQNIGDPNEWAFTGDVSGPIQISILDRYA